MESVAHIERSSIKVIHIITIFSLGGATENTLLSVEGLEELGYDIRILTGRNIDSEGSLFERALENRIRVEILPELRRSIHPFYDLIALFKIYRILRREKFHIVHTHSSKAGIIGRIAARLAGVPIVLHTIHGLPFHDYQNRFTRQFFIWAERIGARCSQKIISVTDTIVQKALQVKVGRPEQHVTIRSGFEMKQFLDTSYDTGQLRIRYGFASNDKIIGKIARFSRLKGHSYLLDALPEVIAHVPEAKLLLVGSGELENEFKKHVSQLGLQGSVVFAGLVPQAQMPETIAMMDVVVHTSLLEGLARVLPQAFASGKPVVSFDIDGAHEVVINGLTGCLVPPKDRSGLARAIIELLVDETRAHQYGQAGRKMVKCEWTREAMVASLDQQYLHLIERYIPASAVYT